MSSLVKKGLRILLRYGPFLFIPAFLYLAYNYVSAKSPKYKVTARVSIQGVPQQSAINSLGEKNLVSKTLAELPFQASYYFANQPKNEIYPDSSPVKVTVKSMVNSAEPVEITLRANDKSQFELTQGDTSEFHKFGAPVSESYGSFVVMFNPKTDSADKTVNVQMVPQAQVLEDFYKNYHVEAGHKEDVIQLDVVAANPKKGAEFLNAMLNAYGGSIHKDGDDAPVAKTINTVQYDTIRKAGKDVSGLKEKVADLTRQIASLKEQEKKPATVQVKRGNIDKNQAKIYQAVDSYIKQPIDQFVQVPYVDEIENPDLNDMVSDFNDAELARRRMTSQTKVDSMNRKLMTLRSNIVEQIRGYLKSGHSESNQQLSKAYYEEQIAAKQRRLDEINSEIKTAPGASFTVQKTTKTKTVNVSQASSKLVVLDKPEDNVEFIPVKATLIYALALLAGLLFPIAGWIIRVVRRNSSGKLIDGEKLSGKINDLFQVKQID